MVTAAALTRLEQRIERLAVQHRLVELPRYEVFLRFTNETDTEFRARYPDAPQRWDISLRFGEERTNGIAVAPVSGDGDGGLRIHNPQSDGL